MYTKGVKRFKECLSVLFKNKYLYLFKLKTEFSNKFLSYCSVTGRGGSILERGADETKEGNDREENAAGRGEKANNAEI